MLGNFVGQIIRGYVYESWRYSSKVYQEKEMKEFEIGYEGKEKVLQLFIPPSFIIYNL